MNHIIISYTLQCFDFSSVGGEFINVLFYKMSSQINNMIRKIVEYTVFVKCTEWSSAEIEKLDNIYIRF